MSLPKFLLISALLLVGCAKLPPAEPSTPPVDISECYAGRMYMPDPVCMYRHIDALNSPETGFVARQTSNGLTRIVHIDPRSGQVSTIVDTSWSGVHPVWVTGHRAIAYEFGSSKTDGIGSCATNGQFEFSLTLWINAPMFRTSEPMFGRGFDDFGYLFQWTGNDMADTAAVIHTYTDSTIARLPLEYGNPFNCRMSRDGRWMVCQATNVRGILRINRGTGEVRRVIETEAFEPALSPDGRKIVYGEMVRQSGINPSQRIYLADIAEDGTVTNQVILAGPRFEHAVASPVFSPDGKTMAYIFSGGGDERDMIYYHSLTSDADPRPIWVTSHIGRLDWQ